MIDSDAISRNVYVNKASSPMKTIVISRTHLALAIETIVRG